MAWRLTFDIRRYTLQHQELMMRRRPWEAVSRAVFACGAVALWLGIAVPHDHVGADDTILADSEGVCRACQICDGLSAVTPELPSLSITPAFVAPRLIRHKDVSRVVLVERSSVPRAPPVPA